MPNTKIKTVFFDFMGTCLDWHTGALSILPAAIPERARSNLALQWRQAYFDSNTARLAADKPPEDIDITLRETLDALLDNHPEHKHLFNEDIKTRCVEAWHSMPAWPEVPTAITQLKDAGYEVFVFANGTTRLQLDLCQSSGLKFDMLFSSELLGVYKPALQSYRKTLGLVRRDAREAVMVAAHTADLKGARQVGMKTVYVSRWTDDVGVNREVIRGENDGFLEDMVGLVEVIGRL